MKANAKTEAAVMDVMNRFIATHQNRDLEGLLNLLPPDDDQMAFGTGADEKNIGRDQIIAQFQRDWSQTEALAFKITWHQVSAAGSVAWLAAEGLGQGKAGGQEFAFPVRMTAVMEQRGDQWLLVHSHASLPAPGQEEGDSVPV
ncbi:MAG: nuclear transport factor 2 family protein [Anaerolineae bacterium]|nr:nuclear transport factor 2 family protein [Anaerolineae bacterium]